MKKLLNKKQIVGIAGIVLLLLVVLVIVVCVSGDGDSERGEDKKDIQADQSENDELTDSTEQEDSAKETAGLSVHSSPESSGEDSVTAPNTWDDSASNDSTESERQDTTDASVNSGNTESGGDEGDVTTDSSGVTIEDTPDEEGRTYAAPL